MYSQNQEEKIILDYFRGHKGRLLDLGANDGITLSNSRALIELGWAGLLVEASPKAFERLEKLYENNPHVQTLCTAVGASIGDIILYESGDHLTPNDVGLLSSIKKGEIERWGDSTRFREVLVSCMNINMLNGFHGFDNFDFITIDIEGAELDVLPQIDFDEWETKMVCVEFNGKNEQRFKDIMQGFKLIHKNAENLIFSR